ncbi:rhomboid family intramembrane serine protease [Nocardioides sp. HDW12B]|uniref:rhomboid family intramembrane serine protease n=1 Tax=Nocardioides sp. HDW12B TaxID=2714939 RepID=UPI001F0DC235|nr:rhomboid family intramembrane serine protease [Nocardioides sp. HDW12B]
MDQPGPGQVAQTPTCYRHSDRETYIRCQRCERPICPDCMRSAAVGFQCPDCVAEGARSTRQARTAYGGTRPTRPGAVTQLLIAANVSIFVLVLAAGGVGSVLLSKLALVPLRTGLVIEGRPTLVEGVADGAVWQLVTSMFTHVEIWHIGFNMLALFILGPQLELLLGRARFLALYLMSGLVGSAAVYWLSAPNSLTIGASGAIFGLMGALLVVAVKVKGDVQSLLTLVAINLVITVLGSSFISWQGHLGGFVGGLVIGGVLVYAPRRRRTAWQVAGLTVVGLLTLAAIAVRTLTLT